MQNKIGKQNDKKDRISGAIICPLINYNNMSVAVSFTR